MARKKKHSATASTTASTTTTTMATAAVAMATARDASPEKVERLKSLNHLLLKEVVERREQVSQLLSRIDNLALDHSFLSATEQDVTRIVLASHLADLRRLATARELSDDAKARDLESSLASMAVDRDAIEKEVRSLSEALKQADEKLNMAAREKEEIENSLKNELEKLQSDVLDLQDKCRDYNETNNNLLADNDSIQKALRLEKLVTGKLKSQVDELTEQNKGSVWNWLYPVITTVFVAVSFAYATRRC